MDCQRRSCPNLAQDSIACAQCFKSTYCSEACLEQDWASGHEASCPGHDFSLADLIPTNNLGLLIGRGAYSEVRLVQHRKTKKFYALKSIEKEVLSSELPTSVLFREIALHKRMDHANIVKLYDQLEDQNRVYLVLEYATGCNLAEYLKSQFRLSEPEAAKFFVEICMGLKHMHDKGIVHRDLKPENILVTEDHVCKICDLGWSASGERTTYCGTMDYLAPEVLTGTKYAFPADLWSLGVVLYEMLHGTTLFPGVVERKRLELIRAKEFSIDQVLSQSVRSLLQRMLSVDPSRRPSLTEILQHRWIQEQDIFSYEIEAGRMIRHLEHGVGTVTFTKGLICKVDFGDGGKEFVIPDLIKEAVVVKQENEDTSFMLFGLKVERNVSPIPGRRDSGEVEDQNTEDYLKTLSFDMSTMSMERGTRKTVSNANTQIRMERENELRRLQTSLEKKIKGRHIRTKTSAIDVFFEKDRMCF
jgi:serine/threonine protein kinase